MKQNPSNSGFKYCMKYLNNLFDTFSKFLMIIRKVLKYECPRLLDKSE